MTNEDHQRRTAFVTALLAACEKHGFRPSTVGGKFAFCNGDAYVFTEDIETAWKKNPVGLLSEEERKARCFQKSRQRCELCQTGHLDAIFYLGTQPVHVCDKCAEGVKTLIEMPDEEKK